MRYVKPEKYNTHNKIVAFLIGRVDCNDGVASHCETLIRGLKTLGWRVILITGAISYDESSRRRFDALTELSEDWIVLDRMQSILPSAVNIFKIKKIVKQYKISLFHAHGYSMLGLAYIFKIAIGLKCVATFHPSIHGTDPKLLKQSLSRSQLIKYQIYLRLFSPSFFIALSSDIERFLIQDLGFNKTRVCKVLAGIDTKYFRFPSPEERQRAREKFGFEKEDLVCTLVGRLNWNKGHDVLIDAIRHVTKVCPETSFKCLLVGSGNQEKQIKEYALSSNDASQYFLFWGYVEELREVYWSSNIFILPSRLEGFALVVVEAMSCGNIPIRTPGGGASDQIEDGINGFIIPFDSVEVLSSRLIQLAKSPALGFQIVENAVKSSSKKFTLESMTLGTIEVYEAAIK